MSEGGVGVVVVGVIESPSAERCDYTEIAPAVPCKLDK